MGVPPPKLWQAAPQPPCLRGRGRGGHGRLRLASLSCGRGRLLLVLLLQRLASLVCGRGRSQVRVRLLLVLPLLHPVPKLERLRLEL